MEHLNLLEQEVLEVLKQLEYCCNKIELHQEKKTTESDIEIIVMASDLSLTPVFKKWENLDTIAAYLQKKDLDISIIFQSENNSQLSQIEEVIDVFSPEHTKLAVIRGGSLEAIKTKITDLILSFATTQPSKIRITYNMNLGQLVINDAPFSFAGKQKDVIDCLVKNGKDIMTSWDVLHEEMNEPNVGEIMDKREEILAKKSVNGAVSEINTKTEASLTNAKLFIGLKGHEYWIQYKVDIDG